MAQHFAHFRVAGFAFAVDNRNLLVRLNFAALDAADADHAQVVVIVQLRDLHLQRAVQIDVWRRYVVDDRLVQRGHVVSHIGMVDASDTLQRRGVNNREIELLVGRVKVNEQVEHLIDNPVRTRARAVNFVDDHDRLQAVGKCFFGHETRLRHWAVHRVDNQQH